MKRQSRNNNRNNSKKEQIVVIASAVFVLAALTLTGVYVKSNSDKAKNDGYNIDFSLLEDAQDNTVQDKVDEINNQAEMNLFEDDLDYTPMEQVDSPTVEIPGVTGQTDNAGQEENQENNENISQDAPVLETDNVPDPVNETVEKTDNDAMDQAAMDADAQNNVLIQPEPDFQAGDTLIWPVTGNVLIPYSMDKMVYFSTLEHYKRNPAMIISATEGAAISAAASGQVTNVFYNEEIGNAVTVNIGNGYEITYGQLKDIAVTNGSYIEKGSIIGYVAAPTKYYSVEGTNVYFSLTLNGEPADPMGKLQ